MDIQRVVVLGAGTMGHGIAHVAAQAGLDVGLFDVQAEAIDAGLAKIQANLEKGVAKGKVTEEAMQQTRARISSAGTELTPAVQTADLVIEAAPESLDLKCAIFETLGQATPAHAILASNTSSLPLADIAEASGRPQNVVGMHFFNPVHIMALLELVHTAKTSEDALQTSKALGERMGKNVIVVRDSPGFATSRLGLVLGLEAIRMVEEGVASPGDIDKAMELGYRHPMGPLKLTDLVGLDVRLGIAEHLANVLDDRRFDPPKLLRQMVEEGKLGKKSGEGFFDWSEG